jgi:plasmid stability protein
MSVNLSIKNVPDELADRLRERAARNHRSVQGELMHILETALADERRLTAKEAWERVRAKRVATGSDAVRFVREDRDDR